MGDENGGKWFAVGLDGCLFLYPDEKWEGFVKQLKSLLRTKEAKQLQRYFLANAAKMEMDGQGRIMIPAHLRSGIKKEAVFVGIFDRVELWDGECFDANPSGDMESAAEAAAAQGLIF
ncbi:MAG: division/cell wall cluster transcriptional repressor MraZ [Lachnospiraceae bacterium]|jgi:MraZ protein|nr:division/cell wall cluster transcriptional repressor MraZ [Lachnospiraceae bacterium]